ncbi:hypothetical protein SARC_08712 [Sphaeroforma arctica JP610]|uniref:PAS domain-containing protein n=1 Tax=Sphaeroforma arctica JP610 TaxID=667725 RepID=A0A0L0FQ90_9EUKA|nr:hypothetical protein SARC_08712 [Sphaeroforma arctica JP610]KNC78874.1 hypothetical protein SARC_08712 [Sphaeroforma arctica JP610]|eukprot:XP_014152776.1 hypothetical protein SARC_08712 [Sphaeroforma arctica JP610]
MTDQDSMGKLALMFDTTSPRTRNPLSNKTPSTKVKPTKSHIKALKQLNLFKWSKDVLDYKGTQQDDDLKELVESTWLINRTRSLSMILQDETGMQLFETFLWSEQILENLSLWKELEGLKTLKRREHLQMIGTLVSRRFVDTGTVNFTDEQRTDFQKALQFEDNQGDGTLSTGEESKKAESVHTLPSVGNGNQIKKSLSSIMGEEEENNVARIQGSLVALMAVDSFPRFLASNAGKDYLTKLMVRVKKKELPKLTKLIESENALKNNIHKKQLSSNWMASLISMGQMLPFCITISARTSDEDLGVEGRYPLCYINEQFTSTTGYTKTETIGRSCRFLQGPDSEPEPKRLLKESVENGTKLHVTITNYTKDQKVFKNCLTLFPIHNDQGVVQYIVGIQYDATDNSSEKMANLQPILNFLDDHKTI